MPASEDHGANAAFEELGALTAADRPLDDILRRTVDLTKSVLRVPVEASVTLVDADRAMTPASTTDTVRELDETQYLLGYGPCLAAAEGGQLVSIADLADESRWPDFTAAARGRGVRSMLSVPLPVQRQVIGALNMYSTAPGGFRGEVVTAAERFGTYAAVAIANARLLLSTAELAEQMAQAMRSRAGIEQAKGILMRDRHCGADEAFDILVNLSQASHRKLREVAQLIVDNAVEGRD